jgi:uncharacterized protein
MIQNYPAKVERAILFTVEAFSENCSQNIPLRYSEAEVETITAPLRARILELEQLAAMSPRKSVVDRQILEKRG